MNRTFALGLITAVIIWFGFYAYDSGDDHRVDYAVIGFTVLVGAVVIAHLFLDRGVTIWNSGTTGILIREVGWIALFLWFGFRLNGRLTDPGISQGLLDVVRTVAPFGGALLIGFLIRNRFERRRAGEPTPPTELLIVAPEKPWQEGDPDRRVGPRDRRRTTAEIYGRTTEDTTL